MFNKLYIKSLLLIGVLVGSIVSAWAHESKTIITVYGSMAVTDSVLLDLLEDPMVKRIQKIRQYDMWYYTYKPQEYTRYTHCVGVWYLINKFGGSLKEQIAGLLHDVSHTAFGHVADHFYKKGNIQDSYQDDIHEQFIKQTSLTDTLKKHGYVPEDVLPKSGNFKLLEQELPDICADRLEYNLYGGLIDGLITQKDVHNILDSLRYKNERWYFKNIEYAKQFAQVSLDLTRYRWASARMSVHNHWAVQMLKRAFKLDILKEDQFKFGTDDELWSVLTKSEDAEIKEFLHKLHNPEKYFVVANELDFDMCYKSKCRGINPWIKINKEFKRLTQVDSEFKENFESLQEFTSRGYIKFIEAEACITDKVKSSLVPSEA